MVDLSNAGGDRCAAGARHSCPRIRSNSASRIPRVRALETFFIAGLITTGSRCPSSTIDDRSPYAAISRNSGNAGGYYRAMPGVTRTTALSCRQRRRRGAVLQRALYEATLAELSDAGYGRLTMEGIAARAHTGKAALYRRWSSKRDLVYDALVFAKPPLPELPAGRSAREDLLAMLTAHRDLLAGKSAFPGADIIRQLVHEPELRAIVADAVVGPRLEIIDLILRTAVEDGDIDSAMLTPLTARVGPALINEHFMLTGKPPSRQDLAQVVDTVIRRAPGRAIASI